MTPSREIDAVLWPPAAWLPPGWPPASSLTPQRCSLHGFSSGLSGLNISYTGVSCQPFLLKLPFLVPCISSSPRVCACPLRCLPTWLLGAAPSLLDVQLRRRELLAPEAAEAAASVPAFPGQLVGSSWGVFIERTCRDPVQHGLSPPQPQRWVTRPMSDLKHMVTVFSEFTTGHNAKGRRFENGKLAVLAPKKVGCGEGK